MKKRGFTLIELLVVIALIALLISILVPSLVAAKAQVRAVVCRSNLRQLLYANISYAIENDEHYVPAAEDMFNMPSLRRWHGQRENPDDAFEPAKGPLAAYLSDGLIKRCPQRVGFVTDGSWDDNFEAGCGGYGYNMTYIGSSLWKDGLDFKESYRITTRVDQVGNPGATLMFADSALSKEDGTCIEYSFVEPPFVVYMGETMDIPMSPSLHFRHDDKSNIGWADGHVDRRGMAIFEEDNVFGVKSSSMNLGWFEPIDNRPFDLK